jgi:hypothetical protein
MGRRCQGLKLRRARPGERVTEAERMRRLITLISAGRNRIVMIRRELPRTENANWVSRPYRTKYKRILRSVGAASVPCSALRAGLPRQSLPFPLNGKGGFAWPPGPVQAERSEPQGSLEGWRRCDKKEAEGMAGDTASVTRPFVVLGTGLPCVRQWPR